MSDAIFDATVVSFANSTLAGRRPGTSAERRFNLLDGAAKGRVRIRYNTKLLTEYVDHIRERRNDAIRVFFDLLDSGGAIRVQKSTLSRQDWQRARAQRWPRHDQHLLAAAVDGDRPSLYVTERRLANCSAGIQRIFGVYVRLV
jgi:hypothetical protein